MVSIVKGILRLTLGIWSMEYIDLLAGLQQTKNDKEIMELETMMITWFCLIKFGNTQYKEK